MDSQCAVRLGLKQKWEKKKEKKCCERKMLARGKKPYFMTKAKNFTDTKHSMAQECK